MSHGDPIPVLHAEGLTKRYGRREALSGVDLHVPSGRVVGLVGPNGAGKSTLLNLACGLLEPTSGSLRVLGSRPGANAARLARVGFVAQNTPVYPSFSVADHLRMGARLNPSWDGDLAERRIAQVGLKPEQKAGRLSGGQRAQLALTVAAAKRPELLIFDEPAAALDPLARQGFMANLMEFVTELGAGAVLSSHLLGDIEQVCDHLVVLCGARVQVAGEVRDLLAGHHRLAVPGGELGRLPAGVEVVRTEPRGTIVRTDLPASRLPFPAEPVTLEELVLGYMSRADGAQAVGATR
ncbi:ABC transporter ATP-binding protein [Actinomadura algeriensis]|uniref:ABC-2 type transport system ATP-binding protein n=1 Tax=Actinomadura algeriensis TaxID=1679523 RepID=A0ABR9JRR5_9ACTN|nr:ABC transporter ATP-binding protein [Actinomadura algeriensis]MBE1533173.1 ABC-2 type transport system ATP-binding protein [Actinomadura algeriensis]